MPLFWMRPPIPMALPGVNFPPLGQVRHVEQQRVGAGFFRVLGIAPEIGREFTATGGSHRRPAARHTEPFLMAPDLYMKTPLLLGQLLLLKGRALYRPLCVMPEEPPHQHRSRSLDAPSIRAPTGEGPGGTNYAVAGRLKTGMRPGRRPTANWNPSARRCSSLRSRMFRLGSSVSAPFDVAAGRRYSRICESRC